MLLRARGAIDTVNAVKCNNAYAFAMVYLGCFLRNGNSCHFVGLREINKVMVVLVAHLLLQHFKFVALLMKFRIL